jgi:bacterioferritin-associated ferredoxin
MIFRNDGLGSVGRDLRLKQWVVEFVTRRSSHVRQIDKGSAVQSFCGACVQPLSKESLVRSAKFRKDESIELTDMAKKLARLFKSLAREKILDTWQRHLKTSM